MPSIAVTCTAWAPARPTCRTEQATRTKRTPTSSRDMAPGPYFWVQHAPLLRHWSQALDADPRRPTHFAARHRLFSPHTPVNVMAPRCPHTWPCSLHVRVWVKPFISTVIVAVWLDHFHLSWLWRWGFSFPKKKSSVEDVLHFKALTWFYMESSKCVCRLSLLCCLLCSRFTSRTCKPLTTAALTTFSLKISSFLIF